MTPRLGIIAASLRGAGGIVPPIDVDPHFASVSLLLHMDGANGSTVFNDSSANPRAISVIGDAKISTTQSKFGGASFYTQNGNTDYIEVNDSNSASLGSAPFTIEGWVSANVLTNTNGLSIMGNYSPDPVGGWLARFGRNGNTQFTFGNDNAVISVPFVVSLGVWFHFAICRDNNGVRIYRDGVLAGSIASFGNTSPWESARKLRVGSDYDGVSGMQGYVDDLRVTKGVARYTANFTPPTAAFPNQ